MGCAALLNVNGVFVHLARKLMFEPPPPKMSLPPLAVPSNFSWHPSSVISPPLFAISRFAELAPEPQLIVRPDT